MRLLGIVPASEMKSTADSFSPGDVLYGRLRPYLNKVYSPDFKGLCSTEFIIFRKTPNVSSKYLQYFLNSTDFVSFANSLNAGDRPRVKIEQLSPYPFPLPPLPEQERIVERIESLFTQLEAGVSALKRARVALMRYKASVLKAACEGRLVAQDPNDEPAEEVLRRILAEREEKYVPPNGELPELPRGWCWTRLQVLAANEPFSITDGPFGSNLKTEHYTESGPRVVRLQNIGEGIFCDAQAHISYDHFNNLTKHQIYSGDVVIAALGESLPRACIIPSNLGPAIVKADCIRLKPNPNITSSNYLNVALNSDTVKKLVSKIIHGVGRPRMNQTEIKSLLIPLPPLNEQYRISAEVELRLSVVQELEQTIEANLKRAGRLRQAILKRAFEGRLL